MAQPQLLQVKLSRFDAQPWGFRLQGGTDFAQPLLVQKVNAGSLSEQAGLQPGDAVVKINDVDVFNLRHKDAQDIVVRSGNNFVITVQRGGSTWRSYFDNGANKSPLMNCQKVVAKDPDTRKVVTARFCQLDTGDSDACEILRTKLRIPSPEEREQRNRNQNKRRKGHGQDAEEDDEISAEDAFFCGICKSHRCNGAAAVTLSLASILAMIALQLGC